MVMPLMTTASGAKFGKTEAGTVWLDAGAHVAVPFLPVLVQHRRSRRRAICSTSRFWIARPSTRSRRSRARRRSARGAARARARGDGARPRRGSRHPRRARVERVVRRGHRDAGSPTMCWRCSRTCRRRSCPPTRSPARASPWSIWWRACSSRRRRARRGVWCSRAACT